MYEFPIDPDMYTCRKAVCAGLHPKQETPTISGNCVPDCGITGTGNRGRRPEAGCIPRWSMVPPAPPKD